MKLATWLSTANLLVSLALLVVTLFYLFATIQISNASVQQTEAVARQTEILHAQNAINYRPYVTVVREADLFVESEPGTRKIAQKTDWFEIHLNVENVGNVMAKLKVDELTFDGKSQPGATTETTVLMPKQKTKFRGRFSVPPVDPRLGIPGEGRFRITYWLPTDPSTTYTYSVGFQIATNAFLVIKDVDAN